MFTTPAYDLGYLPERGNVMNTRQSRPAERGAPSDVGTLWTMRRLGCMARCALMAWPTDWELRVLVDRDILLSERCPRGAEAFALADEWRYRMLDQGWLQIVPPSELRKASVRQAASEAVSFRAR
jgi:hypothetical protein